MPKDLVHQHGGKWYYYNETSSTIKRTDRVGYYDTEEQARTAMAKHAELVESEARTEEGTNKTMSNLEEESDRVSPGLKEFESALADGDDVTKAFRYALLTKEQAITHVREMCVQALYDEQDAQSRQRKCLAMLRKLKEL